MPGFIIAKMYTDDDEEDDEEEEEDEDPCFMTIQPQVIYHPEDDDNDKGVGMAAVGGLPGAPLVMVH